MGHYLGPIQQGEEPEPLDALQVRAGRGKSQEAREVALDVGGAAPSLSPLRCWALQVHGLHQPRLERLEVRTEGARSEVRGCEPVRLRRACIFEK